MLKESKQGNIEKSFIQDHKVSVQMIMVVDTQEEVNVMFEYIIEYVAYGG